jgi:hypothetical protein
MDNLAFLGWRFEKRMLLEESEYFKAGVERNESYLSNMEDSTKIIFSFNGIH